MWTMRCSEASAREKSSDQLDVTVKGDRLSKSDDAAIMLALIFFLSFLFFFSLAFWRQQLNIKTHEEHSRNSLLTKVESNAIHLERNIWQMGAEGFIWTPAIYNIIFTFKTLK